MKTLFEKVQASIFAKWPDYDLKPCISDDSEGKILADKDLKESAQLRFVVHKDSPKGIYISFYGDMLFQAHILPEMRAKDFNELYWYPEFDNRGLRFQSRGEKVITLTADPNGGKIIGSDIRDEKTNTELTFTEESAIDFILHAIDN